MGERKVVNHYIPADFDPSLIPRGKKLSSKDGTVPVRMMLPFSMQCSSCQTFLYRGRKYNSRKENVQGPDGRYLGIQRFRFYIKCNHCSRPISFLTDPKNADYEMESGATRNFELHRNTKKEQDDEDDPGGEQQDGKEDPMKALENRVLDSQREMADLDNLEEIKAMNARHLKIDPLEALQLEEINEEDGGKDDLLTEEDEALIQSIRFGKSGGASNSGHSSQQPTIKRLTAQDEERLDQERRDRIQQQKQQQQQNETKPKSSVLPVQFKVKKKRRINDSQAATTTTKKSKEGEAETLASKEEASGGGLSSLLGGYGSSSDSD